MRKKYIIILFLLGAAALNAQVATHVTDVSLMKMPAYTAELTFVPTLLYQGAAGLLMPYLQVNIPIEQQFYFSLGMGASADNILNSTLFLQQYALGYIHHGESSSIRGGLNVSVIKNKYFSNVSMSADLAKGTRINMLDVWLGLELESRQINQLSSIYFITEDQRQYKVIPYVQIAMNKILLNVRTDLQTVSVGMSWIIKSEK